MYIYKIQTEWYNEELKDYIYGSTHIISNKKYTHEEFTVLCEEARNSLGNDTWDIDKYLIEKYDFKYMSIEASFEYDPYEDE
ncbi:chaperone protein DnaK [Clostridium botulinum B str. Osaka05]|uniref:Chaperone protein DnaK n=1 Tax=Clostridium botulinum B str. Osaka05 TaxID=1407017 RepID=A0A060N3D2_CLOBO|nr:hypothetical protein [Clostridium botulinum]BAO05006.1 chaperone protein DnaK [Clostridium botulinum B str. Osaka05]